MSTVLLFFKKDPEIQATCTRMLHHPLCLSQNFPLDPLCRAVQWVMAAYDRNISIYDRNISIYDRKYDRKFMYDTYIKHVWWPSKCGKTLLSTVVSPSLVSSVQFSHSVVYDSLRPHEPQHARPSCPSSTPRAHSNPCSLSQWWHPTISSSVVPFSSCPQPFPASGSFQMSAVRIRRPKYWTFSFNIHPANEHPRLISFGMDWLDLLAVQGTLKSLLQHHSSKASILLCSAFFMVQLSHPYMTTGKTIALTRRTFVDKVMSLLLKCSV